MADLNYLVIEYAPQLLDNYKAVPVRIDGHYGSLEMAEEVSALWAESPLGAETRIVVAEIRHQAKAPRHWVERQIEEERGK